MAWVFADHHDATVATNDLALVANLLDAWVNLHVSYFFWGSCEPVFKSLLVAVDNAPTGQVIGAELYDYAVLWEDTNVVLAHLARDVRKDLVTIGQLYTEHCVRQSLNYCALDLDDTVFVGHKLTYLRCSVGGLKRTQNTQTLE